MAVFAAADKAGEVRDALAGAGVGPALIGRLETSRGPQVEMQGRLAL